MSKTTPIALFIQYKPALIFLARFLGVYVLGNILYGFYITGFETVDPITNLVSEHTAWLMSFFGSEVASVGNPDRPTTTLIFNNASLIDVYEGCNAINVTILFIAFLAAYKGSLKNTALFTIIGILSIYLFNLVRLAGLVYVAAYFPDQMYLMHKFVFTGVIYAFIFLLWFIWVKKIAL